MSINDITRKASEREMNASPDSAWTGGDLLAKERDPEMSRIVQNETKLRAHNRSIITSSKTIEELKENLKKCCCSTCYRIEALKYVASEDYEDILKDYEGRLILNNFTFSKHRHKSGDWEHGLNIHFKRCAYCGTQNIMSFTDSQLEDDGMNPELFKSMSVAAKQDAGEVV